MYVSEYLWIRTEDTSTAMYATVSSTFSTYFKILPLDSSTAPCLLVLFSTFSTNVDIFTQFRSWCCLLSILCVSWNCQPVWRCALRTPLSFETNQCRYRIIEWGNECLRIITGDKGSTQSFEIRQAYSSTWQPMFQRAFSLPSAWFFSLRHFICITKSYKVQNISFRWAKKQCFLIVVIVNRIFYTLFFIPLLKKLGSHWVLPFYTLKRNILYWSDDDCLRSKHVATV